MAVRVNRFMAIAGMCLLFPLVFVIRLVRFLSGHRKPAYENTISGDPLAYDGPRPLLIAVWEEGASIWPSTAAVVEQLKAEFAHDCEFAYVEATSRDVIDTYQAKIVPLLILRHHRADVERFVNTMDVDEVRPTLVKLLDSIE